MRVYYFIHLTGRDNGTTGVQRVVRNLGHALQDLVDIEIVPVRWSRRHDAIVHAERAFFEFFAEFRGPSFSENRDAGRPVHEADDADDFQNSWLLIPEVPHLKSHDARFPSVQMSSVLGHARSHGLRTAVILHDLLPLTEPAVTDDEEREKLAFTAYAQSLVNADLVFPVSLASAQALLGWLQHSGFRPDLLPRIMPVALAEEVPGIPRKKSRPNYGADLPAPTRFVSFGTVCRRKNQLKAFEAFNRVRTRHPKLSLEFYVVGTVDPELAGSIARQVARANGSIKMYGFLTDERLLQLIDSSHVSVFVSLAEGFGLPIAESLWLGKPCLCSNIGAMAEIASGGGCLAVDPANLAEIEGGFEQMVTNRGRYNRLLEQLATRKLRTWQDYASDIRGQLYENGAVVETDLADILSRWAGFQPTSPLVEELIVQLETSDPPQQRKFASEVREHLDAKDGGTSLSRWMEKRYGKHGSAAARRSFHIDLKSLKFHDEYLKRGKAPIFDQTHIRYRRDDFSGLFKKVKEPHLFYGPYIRLGAGTYLFSIDGDLTGSITIKFMKDHGTILGKMTLTTFADTLSLEILEPVANFEIVGEKTDQTEALEIRSIFVEFVPPGQR